MKCIVSTLHLCRALSTGQSCKLLAHCLNPAWLLSCETLLWKTCERNLLTGVVADIISWCFGNLPWTILRQELSPPIKGLSNANWTFTELASGKLRYFYQNYLVSVYFQRYLLIVPLIQSTSLIWHNTQEPWENFAFRAPHWFYTHKVAQEVLAMHTSYCDYNQHVAPGVLCRVALHASRSVHIRHVVQDLLPWIPLIPSASDMSHKGCVPFIPLMQ